MLGPLCHQDLPSLTRSSGLQIFLQTPSLPPDKPRPVLASPASLQARVRTEAPQ